MKINLKMFTYLIDAIDKCHIDLEKSVKFYFRL